MSSSRSVLFATGMLLGTAVGTVAGLIAAPRTGKETRRLLKKTTEALPELAEDLSDSLQIQAHRLSGSALQRWDETLDHLKEAIIAGSAAAQAQRQRLQEEQNVTL